MKCDEKKPSCSWCTRAGKTCHYATQKIDNAPENAQNIARRSLLPYVSQPQTLKLNLVPGSGKEKRSFEFYVSELGDMLAGSFDAEFWKQIIVQRSCTVPALWHSLVSLSMFTELRDRGMVASLDTSDPTQSRSAAIQHYNKALRLSSSSIASKDSIEIEGVIINSIVFTLIELVLVDVSKASLHLSSGGKLLEIWRRENPVPQPHQKRMFEDFLIPIFDYMGKLMP